QPARPHAARGPGARACRAGRASVKAGANPPWRPMAGRAALQPPDKRGLVLSGRSAPPAGHQIDIGSRLEERVGRGFDAVHARDRIEYDLSLLAGVVRRDFLQIDLAERELRAVLGPADGGIVDGVTFIGQLHDYAEPDRFLCNSLFDLVEKKVRTAPGGFGLVEIFIACDRQHPIAPVVAHAIRVGKLEADTAKNDSFAKLLGIGFGIW